jgi:hypothetical protein
MYQPDTLDCSLHTPYLYDTRAGRVLRCTCCGRIQIEFRGLALLVDAEEFETLLSTVVEVLDRIEEDDAGPWRLAAPTDAGEVSASLDAQELQTLYELLTGAQAMRTLNERLTAVVEGHRRERPASRWPR